MAIVLDRCVEAAESVFAILRAGAVGVPLDPRSPSPELAKFLEHSGARTVITDSRHLGTVRAAAVREEELLIIVITPDAGVVEGIQVTRYQDWAENDTLPATVKGIDDLGLDEPAWLHYTSGTTGEPKGVLSSQRAWLFSGNSLASAFGLTPADHIFWWVPSSASRLCPVCTSREIITNGDLGCRNPRIQFSHSKRLPPSLRLGNY